ncbi:prepilin-type N-terminal cleavage/methylation domain-containing protein [Candidatus Sumerlaeota bacterium]|nr:prepilin-type N-terminal cleavage/methylation domain-containing protein [Candidatus Sumerlaeota bacterium]
MFVARSRGAYTLVEVIVALAILLIGVVGVLQFFPPSLRATREAALKNEAALLAQRKVEELRRDEDRLGTTVREIQLSSAPTVPVPFAEDTRLAYQYSSRSLLYDNVDLPGNPEDDFGVARIIVRYNTEFRPSAEVLYELRFDR